MEAPVLAREPMCRAPVVRGNASGVFKSMRHNSKYHNDDFDGL